MTSEYLDSADFKLYISSSSSDETTSVTYLAYPSGDQHLDASADIVITYTHVLGQVGDHSLYLYIEDPWGGITGSKPFTFTVSGCDDSCTEDDCTAVEDNTACNSCNTGYSSYYDSDAETSFCALTCASTDEYRDTLGVCQACHDSCSTCVSELNVETIGCTAC